MTQLASAGYEQLKVEISRVFIEGHERARQAVERERVATCWEVGRLLDSHLGDHQGGSGYGERMMAQLGADLELEVRRLYEMLEVFRAFQKLRTSAILTFSHYVDLSRLAEPAMREEFARKVEDEGWSVRELRLAIKSEALAARALGEIGEGGRDPQMVEGSAGSDREVAPLAPRKGRLFTYRVLAGESPNTMKLDLGFRMRLNLTDAESQGIEPGTSVECVKDPAGPLEFRGERFGLAVDKKPRTKLYTYAARVMRVIDGDTLWAEIDCGFGISIEEKLRLRAINTPEMSQEEGKIARQFVVGELKRADPIVLTTSRTDLYDRYVADVFYLPGEKDAATMLKCGTYLNRELLDVGLAQRFDEG